MGNMRRRDREMDKSFAFSVMDNAAFGTLATINEDGTPYCIPISYVRHEDSIYIHSAFQGTKMNNIKSNPKITMSFVGAVKVPFPNVESKSSIKGSSVFTTEFESAVITGTALIIEDIEEKIFGLRLICQKYTPDNMRFFDETISSAINITCVIRIDIESITGKRKKYDVNGEEMKWGRME